MSVRRAAAGAVLLAVTGCGVPTGGAPVRIEPTTVPYGLLEPAADDVLLPPPQSPGSESR